MQNEKADFIASQKLAVVGVSRTRGFGNSAFQALKTKGYTVYPVNRQADEVRAKSAITAWANSRRPLTVL